MSSVNTIISKLTPKALAILVAFGLTLLAVILAVPVIRGVSVDLFGIKIGLKDKKHATIQTWDVKGDIYDDWTGQWQVNDRPEGFECIEPYGYSTQMAHCTAIFSGNLVAVRKYTIETLGDSKVCLYFGTRSGNRISGEMLCKDSYQLFPWSVIVSESP